MLSYFDCPILTKLYCDITGNSNLWRALEFPQTFNPLESVLSSPCCRPNSLATRAEHSVCLLAWVVLTCTRCEANFNAAYVEPVTVSRTQEHCALHSAHEQKCTHPLCKMCRSYRRLLLRALHMRYLNLLVLWRLETTYGCAPRAVTAALHSGLRAWCSSRSCGEGVARLCFSRWWVCGALVWCSVDERSSDCCCTSWLCIRYSWTFTQRITRHNKLPDIKK